MSSSRKSTETLLNDLREILDSHGDLSCRAYDILPIDKPPRRTLETRLGTSWTQLKNMAFQVDEEREPVLKFHRIDWREEMAFWDETSQRAKTFDKACICDKTDVKGDWFGILFTADWHLGNAFTDHHRLKATMDKLIETPNLQQCIVGDVMDNFCIEFFKRQIQESVASPSQQTLVIMNILDELARKDKNLAFILGNHDTFDFRASGNSIFQLIDIGAPIANNRLHIDLKFKGAEYKIVAAHKLPGKSMYNKQHENVRELRENNPNADVIASAHLHSPSCSWEFRYGRVVYFLKTGTLKGADDFSWGSWPEGQAPYSPVIAFNTRSKEMRDFKNIDEYAAFLQVA